ncbi:MAG: putative Ig domain-containing protein [Bryobacteraceae bacterium]
MKWTLWLLAWSLMAGRVEAQNGGPPFRITGAVVSREFPPGPADTQRVDPETEFLTTDPMAVVTFGYTGGKKGDKVRVEWRNPFGAVAQEWVIDQVGGSYGWYQNLAIAGAPASKMPGNWELRILWNDQGVATFPFRISVPPASAVHFASSTVLPRGTMNVPFFFQFKAEGGAAPYRWSIVGSAPPGLTLSPTGDLTGVPSRRASYKLVIRVEDSAGNSLTRGWGWESQKSRRGRR